MNENEKGYLEFCDICGFYHPIVPKKNGNTQPHREYIQEMIGRVNTSEKLINDIASALDTSVEHIIDNITQLQNETIEVLEYREDANWIKVQDALPDAENEVEQEYGYEVLLGYPYFKVAIMNFYSGGWYSQANVRWDNVVIAWRTLPHFPEEFKD